MKSDRYERAESLLKKEVILKCHFSKRNTEDGTSIKTCLADIYVDGEKTQLFDHLWIESEVLARAKLRKGQFIKISCKLIGRKRPNEDLFGEPIRDIQVKENSLRILQISSRKLKY